MAFYQMVVDRLFTFVEVEMPVRLCLGNVLLKKLLVMSLLSRDVAGMGV